MSESAPEGGRHENLFTHKIGPLPMWSWVAIAGGGFLVWRYFSSSGSASTSTSTTPVTTPSTPADQVPQFVNQFYLSGVAPTSTNASASVSTSGTSTPVTPPPTNPTNPPGTPRQPTSPVTANQQVNQFPPPTNLRATGVTSSGVTLTWNPVPSGSIYPQSYTVRIYNGKGTDLSDTTVATPDTTGGQGTTTITGLPAKSSLRANVWANGGKVAPKGALVAFKTT